MNPPGKPGLSQSRRGLRVYALVVLVAFGVTLVAGSALGPLRASLQNVVFDEYQRIQPRNRPDESLVRVVNIDDDSIRRIGQWPWPRRTMARVVEKLASAGAAAICMDILFSEPDRSGGDAGDKHGDDAFARVIADRPVVLAEFLARKEAGAPPPSKAGFSFVGEDPAGFVPRAGGGLGPLPALAEAASGIGFVNWQADDDRVVRRVPLLMAVDGALRPSLALEAVRVALGAPSYVVKASAAAGVEAIRAGALVVQTQSRGDIRAYFAPRDPSVVIPVADLLDDGFDPSVFSGKIVVVGASAAMLADVVATPLDSSTPGVEAQAQVIDQLLEGSALLRPDWAPGAEWLAAGALSLLLATAIPLVSAPVSALAGALCVAAMAAASGFAFARHGLLIDPVTPSLSAGTVFLAGVLTLYGQKRRQLGDVRAAFGRFVSPAVVARLAERPEAIELGGQQRVLTVMFCDIRSFTTISETMSATELTTFLNEYLTPMTDAVLETTGTIDKYMGDAIMAFWNAPLDDPEHARNAVDAALAMRAELAALNARWTARAGPERPFKPLKIGVGLNTGECCVGNLGSTRRLDYSAIGDEVNVASRLEGASKVFGIDVVATSATRDRAPDFAWLEIDRVLLKNKTQPTAVFALVGDRAVATTDGFKTLSRAHESMLAAYRAREFSSAAALAAEAARIAGADLRGLYDHYYRERFAFLQTADLDERWAPVMALETK